jgi:hypothetical protein
MKTIYTFLTIAAFVILTLSVSAQEDILFHVVPSDYTSTPGDASFTSQLANSARTYQLLIHESLLTDLIGKELQAISWRLPITATSDWPPAEVTVTNHDIYLSGSVTPANRSLSDFSANVVGPQKMVRAGALVIPANSYTFGNTPNNWGPEIMFDSLYLYTGGHLLIEIRQTGFTGTSRSVDAISINTMPPYGTLVSACWGSGYTANSGPNGNFSIVRITADDPVPVELTSFSASVKGNNVILEWVTATELNNLGFDVERRNLESVYEVVGFVGGSGSTNEPRNYSFTDEKIPGGRYLYRLKERDFDGSFEYSDEIEVEVTTPSVYALEQNYPNPFNPSTSINYSIGEPGIVKLALYNLLGQEVKQLVNEFKEAGPHTITFDASSLTSGSYFYILETSQFKQTKKMVLVK